MANKVLWSGADLNFSIGEQVIFRNAAFAIQEGERVALVGRNGAGKSTLLSVIEGRLPLTGATVSKPKDLRIASLDQEFTLDDALTVREAVREGQAWFYELLSRYEDSTLPEAGHDDLEHTISRFDAWNLDTHLALVMEKLRLERPEAVIGELSGGEKRRVALARAIVAKPDLLLLDEPTNHLDVETVSRIEEFLADYRGTTLLVTHDRTFLDRVATRIVELDFGTFYSVEGSYADFLAAKAEREANEDILEAKRKSFLRNEIEWVRRSPKARLRRNLGRLRRYDEIAAQSAPERAKDVDLVIPRGARLGARCVELKSVSKTIAGRKLFGPVDLEIAPGAKIGVTGANGTGKTTLLKLVTGELPPDTGEVKVAPLVDFNYVDQGKLVLNQERTVYEEVAEGRDAIELGAEKISVRAYLRRFLFEDERINTQIKYLSGGEKARLTLAKILKKGGNFLILDEPTNDLDLSTLRLLEEALAEYPGTILLVSHDRYFLNRVCDGIAALEGDGKFVYSPGDFDYYMEKRRAREAAEEASKTVEVRSKPAVTPPSPAPEKPKKLSFKEQRELAEIETKMPEIEKRIQEIEALFQEPDFYAKHGTETQALNSELEALKAELEEKELRWLELEEKR